MGEEQSIRELDLGIGIPKEDPMSYGEMADDTSVVLSWMTIRRARVCPAEDSFSGREKPMKGDMPWAAVLGCATTYFYSVHSDNIHYARDGATSAARDKIPANQQCSRLRMPHPRAARTAMQRWGDVQGIPRRMS
jgi:hypothetical protein